MPRIDAVRVGDAIRVNDGPNAHPIAVSDPGQGVPTAYDIVRATGWLVRGWARLLGWGRTGRLATRWLVRGTARDAELLSLVDQVRIADVVGPYQRVDADAKPVRDARQGVSALHDVPGARTWSWVRRRLGGRAGRR